MDAPSWNPATILGEAQRGGVPIHSSLRADSRFNRSARKVDINICPIKSSDGSSPSQHVVPPDGGLSNHCGGRRVCGNPEEHERAWSAAAFHFPVLGWFVTQPRTGGTATKISGTMGLTHDLGSCVGEGVGTEDERPAGDQGQSPA